MKRSFSSSEDGLDTLLVTASRGDASVAGAINVPLQRASTIRFPTYGDLVEARTDPVRNISYGIYGTSTVKAFEEAMAQLEGGYGARAVGTGLAAISAAICSLVRTGDHILVVDSAYGPVRRLCDYLSDAMHVEVTYYSPGAEADVAGLLRENSRAILAESPGSQTMEVQDIRLLCSIAKQRSIPVIVDNTWATPVLFNPISHGADIVIHAATKYICGYSDVILGVVVSTEEYYDVINRYANMMGMYAGPDDCYTALRGLRSMAARLARHDASALSIARWLDEQAQVVKVLHPALPGSAGHALWARDFRGSSGLFSFILDPRYAREDVERFVDGLRLFSIGASWGGFESLVLPAFPYPKRSVSSPLAEGTLIRLHIGLENPEDLQLDLEKGLALLG